MARSGVFVTGTDTGVGKTTLGCALLRSALRRGHGLVPFKPVETGCDPNPQDARALWEAAGRPVPLESVCSYTFAPPLAPAAAAAEVGTAIDLDVIADSAARLSRPGRALLVEGAGGLLVPYAAGVTAADLADRLELPLLVAARSALGTINHTALTLAEIRRRGLPLLGVVLVETSPVRSPDQPTNALYIEELTGIRPLGTMPFVPSRACDQLADALEQALDVFRLLAAMGAGGDGEPGQPDLGRRGSTTTRR